MPGNDKQLRHGIFALRISRLTPVAAACRHAGIVALALALLSTPVRAIGLGNAKGDIFLGEAFALDIGLTNPGTLAPECFTIVPVDNAGDDAYFPSGAKVDLLRDRLVVRHRGTQSPVVEFRIAVACGANLARDYIVLPQVREPGLKLATALPSLKIAAVEPHANVEAVAAQGIARTDEMPVASKRRRAAAIAETTPAIASPVAPRVASTARAATPAVAPAAAKASKDRLVVGATGGAAMSPAALKATIEWMESSMAAQGRAQDEMLAKLGRAEESFTSLKEQLINAEARLRVLDAEKERLQRDNERQASLLATLQLVVAVLIGGGVGAVVMMLYQRRRQAAGHAEHHFDAHEYSVDARYPMPPAPVVVPTVTVRQDLDAAVTAGGAEGDAAAANDHVTTDHVETAAADFDFRPYMEARRSGVVAV